MKSHKKSSRKLIFFPNAGHPFRDSDRDGVINLFDCQPQNKRKQGALHTGAQMAVSVLKPVQQAAQTVSGAVGGFLFGTPNPIKKTTAIVSKAVPIIATVSRQNLPVTIVASPKIVSPPQIKQGAIAPSPKFSPPTSRPTVQPPMQVAPPSTQPSRPMPSVPIRPGSPGNPIIIAPFTRPPSPPYYPQPRPSYPIQIKKVRPL